MAKYLKHFDRERFTQALHASSLRPTEIDKKAGLYPYSANRFAAGRGKPNIESLEKICKVMGTNPAEFSRDFAQNGEIAVTEKQPMQTELYLREVRLRLGKELTECRNLTEGRKLGEVIACLNTAISIISSKP